MLLEFKKNNFINIDAITFLEQSSNEEFGIAVVNGTRVTLEKEEYNIIVKAFLWKWEHAIYDKNMKKRTPPIGEPKLGAYHPDFKKGGK